MRLGCCGTIEEAPIIKAAGFDFLEVNVQSALRGDEPDSTWDAKAPHPDKLALPIEGANVLVPPSRPIIGPGRDPQGLAQYFKRVTSRAGRLGIKRLVFGSGGARKRPEGVDQDTAWKHLLEFTKMTGDACAANDIILVIEHLNKSETNTLNSLADCLRLCIEADHPAVQMLVDSYHFGLEHETHDAIVEIGPLLRHVHVAEVAGRSQPGILSKETDPSEAFDFEDFFCTLRKIGYDERICIECRWVGRLEEQAAEAARFLRHSWDNVGHCAI